jgi:HTH-type transcriptional regulator, competence development regulator
MVKLNTLGEMIRYNREHVGVSLRELAGSVDISPTYLSMIERDLTPPPSEDCIRRIADEIDVDADVLLALGNRVPGHIIKAMARRRVLVDIVAKLVDEDDITLNSILRRYS